MFAPNVSKKIKLKETLPISSVFLPVEDLGHGRAIVSFLLLSSPSSKGKVMLWTAEPGRTRKVKHETRQKMSYIKDSLQFF